MALTPDEQVKCRHHLGYINVMAVQTYAFGVPAAMQTQFMIEGAMTKIIPQAENRARDLLQKLDDVECKVVDVLDVAELSKAENVEFNPAGLSTIAKIYKIYQQSLSNLLGIVPNPFDQREWLQSVGGVNAPVING